MIVRPTHFFWSLSLASLAGPAAAGEFAVLSVSPAQNALEVAPNASISIDFDRALGPSALPPATDDLYVFGQNSGVVAGTWTLEDGGLRARFLPSRPLFAGESVTVGLSEDLQALDGALLRGAGWVWRFRVEAEPAPLALTQIQQLSSRDVPTQSTRIYGANALDWNGDDFVDLATINEDSSDVRVFLSRADATGLYHPFLAPSPVGDVPSPNEAADLDGDADADLVTCDSTSSTISVLLGNGDGTFQAVTTYPMGSTPHGLALLDADGDGDQDVAAACTGTNNLGLRLNQGDGTFGPATYFDGGGQGEYGLASADMDGDGILDLVVGCQSSQTIRVLRGNGDATFTPYPSQSSGGAVWMLAVDDLDGDGDLDVTSANSYSNNGTVLLGNGQGGLGAPTSYGGASFSTATDVGDLDGDGDLDWILSCFQGPYWRVYRNNGNGTFALHQVIPGISNPGCATIVDIDQDRDLDAVLLDETGDWVIVMENGALAQRTYCYGDGTGSPCPCGNSGLPAHGCEHSQATGGGLLTGVGRASVSSDAFSLAAGGLPSAGFALFFQGSAPAAAGGVGIATGDGLRCAGGTLVRLGTRATTNGYVAFGAATPGDPAISTVGSATAGATLHYQAWYRDPAAFCTAATFDLTNGLEVTWTP